jgi:hypothetical protein
MTKIDHNQRINDQLADQIAQLIEGVNSEDFTLPFASLAVRPHNVATGHRATGANALIAMLKGSAYYSTFKGWQKLGYQVKTKADFYIARPRRVKTGEQVNESTGDTENQYGVFGFTTDAVWDFSSVRENVIGGFENPWTPPVIDQIDRTERNDRVDQYLANVGRASPTRAKAERSTTLATIRSLCQSDHCSARPRPAPRPSASTRRYCMNTFTGPGTNHDWIVSAPKTSVALRMRN